MIAADIVASIDYSDEWKDFANGQLILHEIGHLLGGIHTSDINSIMNKTSSWISPYIFDELNTSIIKAISEEGINPANINEYFDLVIGSLKDIDYNLADYPELFYKFATVNPPVIHSYYFNQTDIGRSIPFAVNGILYLKHGDKTRAAEKLYKALALASDQASLHYYLSRATDGHLSHYHLKKAAESGYYQAEFDLIIEGKL
jgi:hypothetical protein